MRRDVYSLDRLIGKEVTFVTDCGRGMLEIRTEDGAMAFDHDYCCCEAVWLDDGYEDAKMLVGETILFAEEVSGEGFVKNYNEYDSVTWTFYKISTKNRDVTLRFIGTSNGYYSESVDLYWHD